MDDVRTFTTTWTVRNTIDVNGISSDELSMTPFHHFRLLKLRLSNDSGMIARIALDMGEGVVEPGRVTGRVTLPRSWLFKSDWIMTQPTTEMIIIAVEREEHMKDVPEEIDLALTVQLWRARTEHEE